MQADVSEMRYAEFGDRFMASVIDNILLLPIVGPFLWFLVRADIAAFTGDPFLLAQQLTATLQSLPAQAYIYGLPLLYCVLFWKFRSATPGKMLMDMKLVDATTGGKPTTGRLLLRHLGYLICALLFCIPFIWVAIDKRKQGLHDKMANTVVVMTPPKQPVEKA